MRKDHQSEQK